MPVTHLKQRVQAEPLEIVKSIARISPPFYNERVGAPLRSCDVAYEALDASGVSSSVGRDGSPGTIEE